MNTIRDCEKRRKIIERFWSGAYMPAAEMFNEWEKIWEQWQRGEKKWGDTSGAEHGGSSNNYGPGRQQRRRNSNNNNAQNSSTKDNTHHIPDDYDSTDPIKIDPSIKNDPEVLYYIEQLIETWKADKGLTTGETVKSCSYKTVEERKKRIAKLFKAWHPDKILTKFSGEELEGEVVGGDGFGVKKFEYRLGQMTMVMRFLTENRDWYLSDFA